jgi:hypothetical protein
MIDVVLRAGPFEGMRAEGLTGGQCQLDVGSG